MSDTLQSPPQTAVEGQTRYPVIDTDVHPGFNLLSEGVQKHLPERWREYIAEWSLMRPGSPNAFERPRHREYAHRWDTEVPGGGEPMSNLDFAREQLLDRFDMSGALVNHIGGYMFAGARNMPRQLAAAMCTAMNDDREENWFTHDDRWYGAINLPYEVPSLAVAEIQRRMDGDARDRWKQITIAQDNMRPLGNEHYWPMFEIAEEYNLPIAMHIGAGHRMTPSGSPTYYFEEHCHWAAMNFPTVSSLVFEGVFDRFPNLKFAFIEFGWSWAVPLAWRLDKTYELMRDEVSHLERKPSEYIRDHLWFSTQPMEEPENDDWVEDVFATFDASGMADKIMFSSDYPHWDFDEPSALPGGLSEASRRAILGENASALYGIPLRENSGVVLSGMELS